MSWVIQEDYQEKSCNNHQHICDDLWRKIKKTLTKMWWFIYYEVSFLSEQDKLCICIMTVSN